VFRGVIATTLMVAAAVEPVVNDADLPRYALTQGGLLAVVLVLLWSYRKDTMSILREKENNITLMAEMVQEATAASVKTAEALERMGRAIETMNLRRTPRDH
jgi:hypothetical protein